jgi:hypothetical protein
MASEVEADADTVSTEPIDVGKVDVMVPAAAAAAAIGSVRQYSSDGSVVSQ